MPVKRSVKEILIETELVSRVRAKGGLAEKVTVIGARGFFDRLVVLPGGRVFFVEVKRPHGGVYSPHQILRRRRYAELGAAVVMIEKSEDIDALMATAGATLDQHSGRS